MQQVSIVAGIRRIRRVFIVFGVHRIRQVAIVVGVYRIYPRYPSYEVLTLSSLASHGRLGALHLERQRDAVGAAPEHLLVLF